VPEVLLYLLPLVALAIPLLVRRYPGERALVGLRNLGRRPRWSRRVACVPPRSRMLMRVVRGGRLIACSLAVRPPPVPIATS